MMDLRSRLIRYQDQIGRNPLTIMSLMYDTELTTHLSWQDDHWETIWEMENSMGMVLDTWKSPKGRNERVKNQNKFLSDLHAIQVEMNLQDTVMSTHERFGVFLIKSLEKLESLVPQLKRDIVTRTAVLQMIEHNQELCCNAGMKAKEILRRVEAQINAVCNQLHLTRFPLIPTYRPSVYLLKERVMVVSISQEIHNI
jgi:hypothetical protein